MKGLVQKESKDLKDKDIEFWIQKYNLLIYLLNILVNLNLSDKALLPKFLQNTARHICAQNE